MSLIEVLKRDHREIERLCRSVKDASGADRALVFARLRDLIVAHARGEEQTFYSTFQEDEFLRHSILEGYEEHRIVERLLGEMADLPPDDEQWGVKLDVLVEMLDHHVAEEERDTFPVAARSVGSVVMAELGEAYERLRDREFQKAEWVRVWPEPPAMTV